MAFAREMHEDKKAYRIITRTSRFVLGMLLTGRCFLAYDAQRNKIEKALKDAKLPWEDKCFNVDSFQGTQSTLSP